MFDTLLPLLFFVPWIIIGSTPLSNGGPRPISKNADMDALKGRLTIAASTDETSGLERNKTYADIAIDLNLIEHMDIQNRTFELDSITPNAEVFEALFGAVYLARGLDEARRVALKYIDFEKANKVIV